MSGQSQSPGVRSVAFIGASTGIGLAALKHTLAAGIQCNALCRTPSKLTAIFPPQTTPNLKIIQGNAHDVAAVSKCLQRGDDGTAMVDVVVSTIGGKIVMPKMTFDDPEVCRKGATTLLEAITALRRGGAAGGPHIIVCSTTGISRFGRDTPLAIVPVYHVLGKVPHADKVVMEDRVVASEEPYTIVRASFLTNGESTKPIRVGIEDPRKGRESKAIGYSISREDAGKWIAENLVLKRDAKYTNKIASITY
jgi:nucleoside-diphosphate-sugar epimerase